MSKTTPDSMAFPGDSSTRNGLTKREWFAGLAMQGLLAYPEADQDGPPALARVAIRYADALINELNKEDVK